MAKDYEADPDRHKVCYYCKEPFVDRTARNIKQICYSPACFREKRKNYFRRYCRLDQNRERMQKHWSKQNRSRRRREVAEKVTELQKKLAEQGKFLSKAAVLDIMNGRKPLKPKRVYRPKKRSTPSDPLCEHYRSGKCSIVTPRVRCPYRRKLRLGCQFFSPTEHARSQLQASRLRGVDLPSSGRDPGDEGSKPPEDPDQE